MLHAGVSTINGPNWLSDMNPIDFSRVDLNLLKVFEALYEEGGAGRAGVRLHLTQSAVSAALARLRVLYADHLFERTGRGLRPTPRALELRPLIAQALDDCRQSLAASAQLSGQASRTLRLGLSDDYEVAIGGRLIQLVAAHMPGLRLIFRQTHSLVVSDMLMSREIDLSLTAGGTTSSTLGREVIGMAGYACVGDSRWLRDGPLPLEEYLRRGHLLVSAQGYVGVVDEALKARGASRRVHASTTHFAALPYLLVGSECIATLPQHAARALARASPLHWTECPLPLPRFAVELGWRKDSVRDAAIQRLKALVRQACEDPVHGLQGGTRAS
ncbi:LysR substrate-binding domain-containing protein [Acidovorax sp. FG27]